MNDFLKTLPDLVDEIKAVKDIIITNIVLIGQIPAPTFKEKRRSKVFMERLAEFGVDEVTTDGYRNPIGIIRGTDPEKPPIFVLAHLDTFFERDIVHNYDIKENQIRGPGILDNSLGVGVMVSLRVAVRGRQVKLDVRLVPRESAQQHPLLQALDRQRGPGPRPLDMLPRTSAQTLL